MKKIRAIYKWDVMYNECPVFELRDDRFVMLSDAECTYDKDIVLNCDDDWIVFEIDNDAGQIVMINKNIEKKEDIKDDGL